MLDQLPAAVSVAMEKQKVVFSVVICLCSVFTTCAGESISLPIYCATAEVLYIVP